MEELLSRFQVMDIRDTHTVVMYIRDTHTVDHCDSNKLMKHSTLRLSRTYNIEH